MSLTYNLKEIANKFAKKQAVMADDITEEAPILARVKWETASHGLWNMAEKLNDITGAQFVNADAVLPEMNISSDLEKTDLTVLGGTMEQAEDTIDQFGGAAAYFGKKEGPLMTQAGMDTETKLYYDNWMAKAIVDGNYVDAGASSGTVYSIVIMRMKAGVNMGLFDPTQFDSGSLIKRDLINNGARYFLKSKPGVLGYGVSLKGRFGWQNISDRTVAAILNINSSNLPDADEIDNLLSDIRATPTNTMIMCHPKCKTLAISPFKDSPVSGGVATYPSSPLTMGVMDKSYNRIIDYWNDIPIVTSYNISDGLETVTTGL